MIWKTKGISVYPIASSDLMNTFIRITAQIQIQAKTTNI